VKQVKTAKISGVSRLKDVRYVPGVEAEKRDALAGVNARNCPSEKAVRERMGWLYEVSASPRNARKRKDEQKMIAAIGVWPLFVFPGVDLMELLP
jgi:hypothetical protein